MVWLLSEVHAGKSAQWLIGLDLIFMFKKSEIYYFNLSDCFILV